MSRIMTPTSGLRDNDPRLDGCLLKDVEGLHVLRRRILGRERSSRPTDLEEQRYECRLDASCEATRRRRQSIPNVTIPRSLPIAARSSEILELCRLHQVVVVSGATGSGKTTQLPKLLLQLGLGARGMIGCTQPRRLAATAVAARVADELQDTARRLVGYQVRFDDRTTEHTLIKFMTDGILLASTPADPLVMAYDALIIDEAHERSLNIDFLLGYLRRILPRRPDLRLLISSATMDVARIAAFFDEAPIVQVEGRTYPVELHYRPPVSDDADVPTEVAEAVSEALVLREEGDLLVFLPGESDIHDAKRLIERRWGDVISVLPLYSRLPAEEQRKVFYVERRRRVILSTNVAETSITVPGVRVVVDAGLARIRRYHHRTQVEKRHIEPISQASAEQRKGRCGRIGPGLCVRLYDPGSLSKRPRFTDPEIKRSSLAGVILTMLDLGLGDVAAFPFLDPPKPGMIREGYRELYELGAVDAHHALTSLGRTLARFPIEPRLSRVVIEAARSDVLGDALTVVAALSVDDPRRRPAGKEDAADEALEPFRRTRSDFRMFLNIWDALPRTAASQASSRRQRAFCRRYYLSSRRVEEWRSVRDQLEEICRRQGLQVSDRRADDALLHRTLLTGFVSRIGRRGDNGGYRGARDIHFAIHPRSCLFGASPWWIVATEFVETRQLFAPTVAPIKPSWVEPLAAHLVEREYGAPFWDAETGFVRAEETVRLYGLPIVQGRKRHFGPIDLRQSRTLFIRHALIRGEMKGLPRVLEENRARIDRLGEWEARIRCMDIVISEVQLEDLYDQRIPGDICSVRDVRRWFRDAGTAAEEALRLSDSDVMMRAVGETDLRAFPDEIDLPDGRLPLRYVYAPGEEQDGITCTVPAWALSSLPPSRFEWLVPGRLREKLECLIKGLPKRYRRELVPVPQVIDAALKELAPSQGPLLDALSEWVLRNRGLAIPRDAWPVNLPDHLRFRFELVDKEGQLVDSGRDLKALAGSIRRDGSLTRAPTTEWERSGITEWDFGDLPLTLEGAGEIGSIPRYPGVVDEKRCVSLRLFTLPYDARRATIYGLTRLTLLAFSNDRRTLQAAAELSSSALLNQVALGLGGVPLSEQIVCRAVAEACGFFDQEIPRSRAAWKERTDAAQSGLVEAARKVRQYVEDLVSQAADLLGSLAPQPSQAACDMRNQLHALMGREFVLYTPSIYWPELSRYLRAVAIRLERRRLSATKDDQRAEMLAPFLHREPPPLADPMAWETYRWMIEEWRVSLFAQELGTLFPVSAKRVEAQWQSLGGSAGVVDRGPRSDAQATASNRMARATAGRRRG